MATTKKTTKRTVRKTKSGGAATSSRYVPDDNPRVKAKREEGGSFGLDANDPLLGWTPQQGPAPAATTELQRREQEDAAVDGDADAEAPQDATAEDVEGDLTAEDDEKRAASSGKKSGKKKADEKGD